MANVIVTILEKLKITTPFKNERGGYFLMHDKDSGEVSSVPVDSILSKLNDRVDGIIYPDGFTKTTPINRVGNKVAIAAYDFAWRIQLNPYVNNLGFEETLSSTTSPELKRIDSLAVTTAGTIVYYKGEEDEFVIQPPDIPSDCLRLTDLTIFGDELQDHTEPFVGEVFTLAEKEKLAALNPDFFDLKEDAANKSNFVIDADSTTKFPVWSAVTLWIKEKFNAALPSKSSLELTDVLIIGDNSDSGKTKKISFLNFNALFEGFFLGISNNQNVSGVKTFLSGTFGFRNGANTFTSFFQNSNTASRIYTFKNRNGIVADDKDLDLKINVSLPNSDLSTGAAKALIVDPFGMPVTVDIQGVYVSSTELNSGVSTISIAGVSSSSLCVSVCIVLPSGTIGNNYKATCDTGVLTITSLDSNGNTVSNDFSKVNFMVVL